MMVILGLGSNIGNRLENLRHAIAEIRKISAIEVTAISPIYVSDALLPDNAPSDWDQPYLNTAVACQTTLTPFELLAILKNIELTIGRKPDRRHWGPRIIDIDILVFNNEVIDKEELTIPHASLLERPFSLWPLADLAPNWVYPLEGPYQGLTAEELVENFGSRFTGKAPLHTWQLYQRIDGPKLIGILNITPDSFSDGGFYDEDIEKAINHALLLVENGAEIIDVGAESTAPNRTPIDPTIEWQRLEPILNALKNSKDNFILPPVISVDTYHPETVERVLNFGIDWLNDVTGFTDPKVRKLAQSANVACVFMHHVTIPASKFHTLPKNSNVVETVLDWGKNQSRQLLEEGFAKERLIFDPGIGFGKSPQQSLSLIKNAYRFKELELPVLIGHSRKSFYSLFTANPPQDRDVATAVTSCVLNNQSIDYLRIHNVEATACALKLDEALRSF